MKVQPIKLNNYKTHTVKIERAIFKDKMLDIYTATYEEGLRHKLYYLMDSADQWIKSKLKYYNDGKCTQVIRSEANGRKAANRMV